MLSSCLKKLLMWMSAFIAWVQSLFVKPGRHFHQVFMWDGEDFRNVSYMFDMVTLSLKQVDVMDTTGCYQIYYSVDGTAYRLVLENVQAADLKTAFQSTQSPQSTQSTLPSQSPDATLLSAFSGTRDVTSLLLEFAGPGHNFAHGCLRLKHLNPYGIDKLQIMDSCINGRTFTEGDMIICASKATQGPP